MFRCWQWGLCSRRFTRHPPQDTTGPLRHVWGALRKIWGRAQKNTRRGGTNRGHERTRSGKEEEEKEEKGRCSALEQVIAEGTVAHWGPTAQPRKTKIESSRKTDTPCRQPLESHLASLKGPSAPCGAHKAGKRSIWSEAEAGKGGGMDSPKCFNVYLFCYPVIQYLC